MIRRVHKDDELIDAMFRLAFAAVEWDQERMMDSFVRIRERYEARGLSGEEAEREARHTWDEITENVVAAVVSSQGQRKSTESEFSEHSFRGDKSIDNLYRIVAKRGGEDYTRVKFDQVMNDLVVEIRSSETDCHAGAEIGWLPVYQGPEPGAPKGPPASWGKGERIASSGELDVWMGLVDLGIGTARNKRPEMNRAFERIAKGYEAQGMTPAHANAAAREAWNEVTSSSIAAVMDGQAGAPVARGKMRRILTSRGASEALASEQAARFEGTLRSRGRGAGGVDVEGPVSPSIGGGRRRRQTLG